MHTYDSWHKEYSSSTSPVYFSLRDHLLFSWLLSSLTGNDQSRSKKITPIEFGNRNSRLQGVHQLINGTLAEPSPSMSLEGTRPVRPLYICHTHDATSQAIRHRPCRPSSKWTTSEFRRRLGGSGASFFFRMANSWNSLSQWLTFQNLFEGISDYLVQYEK